jgi:hypothetical protein
MWVMLHPSLCWLHASYIHIQQPALQLVPPCAGWCRLYITAGTAHCAEEPPANMAVPSRSNVVPCCPSSFTHELCCVLLAVQYEALTRKSLLRTSAGVRSTRTLVRGANIDFPLAAAMTRTRSAPSAAAVGSAMAPSVHSVAAGAAAAPAGPEDASVAPSAPPSVGPHNV